MKPHLLSAIRLTFATLVLFTVIYPLIIWGIAQVAPNQGKGFVVRNHTQTSRFYENIGQSFTQDKYFWSRPSAVDYNAAGSGASNKGPSNSEYLEVVKGRIQTFMEHNPDVQRAQIPVDLVTASGSGLDPHISIQAATVQVSRIAKIRNIPALQLKRLIDQQVEQPLFGLFGPQRINVLNLNLALDALVQ